jgi:NAD(P)H-quinone oxidoreductase subunit 5
LLGLATLLNRPLPERRLYQLMSYTFGVSLVSELSAWALMYSATRTSLELSMGSLVSMGGYTLELSLMVDDPSFVMLTLTFVLCGLIAVMSSKYMHREEGAHRYALALTVLAVSVALVASAKGLDLLFVGWELLGIASALLIAFFHERAAPVESGLRAYAVYRITDVGLLGAVVTAHHLYHSADFSVLNSEALTAPLSLGLLLVWGAMGKAAIFPFTGWLPRAMEGPTPSSAIFYGALSIHASPYLLMRLEGLISHSLTLKAVIISLGLITAVQASLSARVQSDVKSALGYASVAQVGLMWLEIGLGWHTLALWHMAGHATYRTWQLIRSPSALQERAELARLLGTPQHGDLTHLTPQQVSLWRRRRYTLALERWYLDELLTQIWGGCARLLRLINALDECLIKSLEGPPPPPTPETPQEPRS